MNAKQIFLDFINLLFIILLVVFCIFYFTVGDHFAQFQEILQALAPVSFISLLFLVKLKINRNELYKRKREDNTDVHLYLTFMDKMWSDAVVFFTPIIIIVFYYWSQRSINAVVIVEACLVFLIMYFWQKYLFNKNVG